MFIGSSDFLKELFEKFQTITLNEIFIVNCIHDFLLMKEKKIVRDMFENMKRLEKEK
jgi:hypothetical protein